MPPTTLLLGVRPPSQPFFVQFLIRFELVPLQVLANESSLAPPTIELFLVHEESVLVARLEGGLFLTLSTLSRCLLQLPTSLFPVPRALTVLSSRWLLTFRVGLLPQEPHRL